MTIGETIFALVVVNSLGILVYILGMALLITRARYSDLEKRYYESLLLPDRTNSEISSAIPLASPTKSHSNKLCDEPLLHMAKNNTPKSKETTVMAIGLAKLPMSSIIRRFAGLSINKEKNLLVHIISDTSSFLLFC
jgi:hypothetical protein